MTNIFGHVPAVARGGILDKLSINHLVNPKKTRYILIFQKNLQEKQKPDTFLIFSKKSDTNENFEIPKALLKTPLCYQRDSNPNSHKISIS